MTKQLHIERKIYKSRNRRLSLKEEIQEKKDCGRTPNKPVKILAKKDLLMAGIIPKQPVKEERMGEEEKRIHCPDCDYEPTGFVYVEKCIFCNKKLRFPK